MEGAAKRVAWALNEVERTSNGTPAQPGAAKGSRQPNKKNMF
jgi:hypothetical protein